MLPENRKKLIQLMSKTEIRDYIVDVLDFLIKEQYGIARSLIIKLLQDSMNKKDKVKVAKDNEQSSS